MPVVKTVQNPYFFGYNVTFIAFIAVKKSVNWQHFFFLRRLWYIFNFYFNIDVDLSFDPIDSNLIHTITFAIKCDNFIMNMNIEFNRICIHIHKYAKQNKK